jgi:ATP/maltotriose-dependent transcriptional regulator MalT/DNA-binding XRE family transcriptional regulator
MLTFLVSRLSGRRERGGVRRVTRPLSLPDGSFDTFGSLLRYLRRKARMTQRDLGLAVGYSEAHVCRLEQGQRLPDPTTAAALFVPALRLPPHSDLAARLVTLAGAARDAGREPPRPRPVPIDAGMLESVPPSPAGAVDRTGRLAELAALLDTERGVLISGLPGMGKTTLAAAAARARTGPVSWITLTRGVNTSLDALLRRLALFLYTRGHAVVAPMLARAEGPAEQAVGLDQQLEWLTAALAEDEPVLVCLDNVHLLPRDEAALAVLRHLLAATRTALLLTSRELLPLPEVAVLRLGGLEPAEARRLITGLVGPTEPALIDPALADRLVDRTAGSPMLLRLAVGQLRGEPDPAWLVEHLQTEPQVTSYLLETTLSGLGPHAQRLLAQLAVFRQPVDLYDELLTELSQAGGHGYDLAPALAELGRRQLVDQPHRADLHPLVRDHLYATLAADPPHRRRLHHVAAVWSERAGGDPLEAAYHYGAAGESDEAAGVLVEYAEDLVHAGHALAAAELADGLAARLARRDGIADPELVVALLTVRGDLLVNTVLAADAEAAYRSALAAAAGPGARAEVTWRLAQSLAQRGQQPEALEACRRAAADLPADQTLLAGLLASAEGAILMALSRFEEAVAASERAIELTGVDQPAAVRAGLGDRPAGWDTEAARLTAAARGRALVTLGVVHRIWRRYPSALAHLERAEAVTRAAGLHRQAARCVFNLGTVRYMSGDMTGAAADFERTLPELRLAGDGFAAARVLHALADLRLNRGDTAAALPLLDEACALKRQLGDENGLANSENERAMVLLVDGDVAAARTAIEAVLDRHDVVGEPWTRAHYLDTLGSVQLVQGELAAAAATFRAALRTPGIERAEITSVLRSHLALTLLAGGDLPGATELADDPATASSTLAELEVLFLHGALALARGDTAELASYADRLTCRVEETTWWRFRRAAAALSAATTDPPLLHTLARLLFILPAQSTADTV